MIKQKEKARLETTAFLCPHFNQRTENVQGRWHSMAEMMPEALERILLNSLKESDEYKQ